MIAQVDPGLAGDLSAFNGSGSGIGKELERTLKKR
jgi:hypothetical protein